MAGRRQGLRRRLLLRSILERGVLTRASRRRSTGTSPPAATSRRRSTSPPVRADARGPGATVIPMSAAATGSAPSGSDEPVHRSAGGASEPPLPADMRADARQRLRLLPGCYPTPECPRTLDARAEPLERLYADLELSGREDLNLRPFGPEPNALPGCATPRG